MNHPMEQVEAAVAEGIGMLRARTGDRVAFIVIGVVPNFPEGSFKTLVAQDFIAAVIQQLARSSPTSTDVFDVGGPKA